MQDRGREKVQDKNEKPKRNDLQRVEGRGERAMQQWRRGHDGLGVNAGEEESKTSSPDTGRLYTLVWLLVSLCPVWPKVGKLSPMSQHACYASGGNTWMA